MNAKPNLIDRDKLGIGLANPDVFKNPARAEGWNDAVKLVMEEPTADAEYVQHGKWIHRKGKSNLWHCSNCGAKMDL